MKQFKKGRDASPSSRALHLLHKAAWATCAVWAVSANPTRAATIIQTGANGANGANATTPGTPGKAGQPGNSATATVTSLDNYNTAIANGGNAGNGGNAINSAGLGGAGGNGAAGGTATAFVNANIVPSATNQLSFIANSTGGTGGNAGQPGNYGSANSGPVGLAGPGGAAFSSGNIFTNGTNGISLGFNSHGGAGGSSFTGTNPLFLGNAGDGGAATLGPIALHASNAGRISLSQTAFGGAGGSQSANTGNFGHGGNGGSAVAVDISVLNYSGFLTDDRKLYGGKGGSGYNGGNGADVSSTFSSKPLLESWFIASATGGDGGFGGTSSSAVGAMGGNGGNATLKVDASNAFRYSNAFPRAQGGNGGAGNSGGNGGDASVIAIASTLIQTQAQSTIAIATAQGGYGGTIYNLPVAATIPAGIGGSAYCSATSTATGDSDVFASASSDAGRNGVGVYTVGGPIVGWAGATARATAFGSNNGISSVRVSASARGGPGGAGNTGGAGGAASIDSVTGISDSGYMTVEARLQGGAGGYGTIQGGRGASALLPNLISGNTKGALLLTQTAFGGAGGASAFDGIGGTGGDALSTLFLTNTNSASLSGSVTASVGIGGSPISGTNTTGFRGRDGTALASISLIGSHEVTAMAAVQDINTGALMNHALATAQSYGGIARASTNHYNFGTNAGVIQGVDAKSTAITSVGKVLNASASASSIMSNTESRAAISQPIPSATNITGLRSLAYLTALPTLPDSLTALTAHPHLQADINLGQGVGSSSDMLGLVSLAGPATLNGGWSTSINESLDLSQFSSAQHLFIGLATARATSTGPANLHFSISREGAMLIDQTFTTLADATAYFTDNSLDLGPLDPLSNGHLDLTIQLDASQIPDGGFATTLLIANATPASGIPEPSSTLLLTLATTGLLTRRRRPIFKPRSGGRL